MPSSARPIARAARDPLDHFRTRVDPLSSLVLTTPVFLLYHLGILFSDTRNGVDLFTDLLVRLVETSTLAYVLVTVGVALGIAVTGFVLQRRGTLKPIALGAVLSESAIWAVVLYLSVGFATRKLLGLSIVAFDLQAGRESLGLMSALVVSSGAGFHEELVFRAGLFAGGERALKALTSLPAWGATLVACVVSAGLFSAAHYVGQLGDPFELISFTFRALMGVMLAFIYRLRGFAIAVYAHALYDVLYFVVLS